MGRRSDYPARAGQGPKLNKKTKKKEDEETKIGGGSMPSLQRERVSSSSLESQKKGE